MQKADRIKYIYLTGFYGLVSAAELYNFALALIAFKLTGKAATGALIYALGHIAEIVASLGVGGLLDSYSKRTIFGVAMITKTASLCSMFVLLTIQDKINTMGFATVSFFIGLLSHSINISNDVLIAKLYTGKDRMQFEDFILAIKGMVKVVSLIMAGILHNYLQTPHLLMISIIFQSIATWIYIYIIPKIEPKFSQSLPERRFTQALFQTIAILQIAGKNAIWRKIFLLDAVVIAILNTATFLLFPLLTQTYHITKEAHIGILMGIGNIGSVGLGIIVSRWLNLHPNQLCAASKYTLFVVAITTLLFALGGGLYSATALIFIFQTSTTLFYRFERIYIQNLIPKAEMGSWCAALDVMERFFCLIGMLLAGYCFDWLGGHGLYILFSVMLILTFILWNNNMLNSPQAKQEKNT